MDARDPIDGTQVPGNPGRPPILPSNGEFPQVRKRHIGLALAAVIFVGMFLLPLTARIFPEFEQWQAGLSLPLTAMLTPGPVAGGHRGFGMQCSACHRRAFHSVPDAACTECHERVQAHLPPDSGSTSQAERPCVGCHAGHAGKAATLQSGLPHCVTCHRESEGEVRKTTDFGDRHPEFRPALIHGNTFKRLTHGAPELQSEQNGLKFSHKAHLVKDGLSTPLGDTVLGCPDCHRLEQSGLHFARMTMKETCQQSRCHTLRLAEPLGALIPHGSEEAVMNKIQGLYVARLLTMPEPMAKECEQSERALNDSSKAMACVYGRVRQFAANKVFHEEGKALQCGLCHHFTPANEKIAAWKVMPVRIQRDWHAKANFSHARHSTRECVDCHDKSESQLSEDVALPGIDTCRECHAGRVASSRKIESRCEGCHPYHRVVEEAH